MQLINGFIERYQRRFKIRTPLDVRTLTTQTPEQYPILLNKAIIKYKQTHYISSSQCLVA